MFSKSNISELLKQYSLVQLYVDQLPRKYQQIPIADTPDENKQFQQNFGDTRLPLYVILEPSEDGKFKEIGRYEEGLINDVEGFARFLSEPLARHKAKLTARANGQ